MFHSLYSSRRKKKKKILDLLKMSKMFSFSLDLSFFCSSKIKLCPYCIYSHNPSERRSIYHMNVERFTSLI